VKYFFQIALRNLKRHKLRTVVSVFAIIIAVIIGIFYRAILLGYSESTFQNYIELEAGHVRIVNQEYDRRERVLPLWLTINGFEGEGLSGMISGLDDIKGLKGVLPRIKFGAAYSRGDEMTQLMGWGIEAEYERMFSSFEDYLTAGRMMETGSREIVLGGRLLDELGQQIGDRITLVYNTAYGSFSGSTFEIVGRMESGLAYLDENVFLLSLDWAQQILGMPDEATELLLFTSDRNQASSLQKQVTAFFEQKGVVEKYQINSWQDAGGIIYWLSAYQRMIYIVMAAISFLAAIVIINTLVMVVKERNKEIGTMGALGMKKREILLLLTTEGAVMGVIGSLCGAVIGGLLTWVTSHTGLDFTEVMEGEVISLGGDSLIESVVYPVFSLENIFMAFIIGVIITTLACVIPGRTAAKISPSEAMKD